MEDLKLIAFDSKDLEIISSVTQDAIIVPSEIAYDASAKHFILPMRRYVWERRSSDPMRKSAVLRFLNVQRVQSKKLFSSNSNTPLSLLAINYGELNENSLLSLTFANATSILLSVEALEVELRDLGAAWMASRQPNHGK